MKKISFIFFFFCLKIVVFAQVKGKVVDENNEPLPYVNILVENENIGTTSDLDGSFSLNIKEEKILIFSILGFEKIKLKSSQVSLVKMVPATYQLGEVVIGNKKETKQIEIGKTENAIRQAFENGPRFDAKFFPYKANYGKNKYIKKVSVYTESNIDEATIKIHFYEVDANGLPGDELIEKDFIAKVKKGSRMTQFDLSKLNMIFPKNGLFVAIERLFIESNKYEKEVPASDPGKTKTHRTYYPLPFYNFVEREFTYTFLGGKWTKEFKRDAEGLPVKTRVFEPAINLILTN
ncbi:carboxypeptidase-like regulatory domain-containing protein [Flavobacterium amniphilum]|uniref:carboxypeptidase-like regulatory domain-containing protein n=1 Tax=Flavobacterium amniphilum TaxID=1834035 RepID=UPI00202A5277|nr:carboxypeptidase-like regulatory domain-containing protein [Flavobacterium amniphilum]MCL9804099.1 carboxypeptidase-like regulatory domain-containing protein [Flavobacterium amniphilum]